eukprot:UN08538
MGTSQHELSSVVFILRCWDYYWLKKITTLVYCHTRPNNIC